MSTQLLRRAQRLSPLSRSSSSLRSHQKSSQSSRSAHSQWYADLLPAMIPVFLLGSAIYLGLQLTRQKLSHQKFMEESTTRVKALEVEIEALQEKRALTQTNQSLAPKVSSGWKWW